MEIDDSLYSRQRCVLGEDAMQKMTKSRVFLSGLGGVGIEIAKNLVLGGVEELIVQDNVLCSMSDMGTQFFIHRSDVDKRRTRAQASLPYLAALNPYVRVTLVADDITAIHGSLSPENVKCLTSLWNPEQDESNRVKCLILTQCSLHAAAALNLFCRQHGIRFIYVDVYGVLGNLFCDFGLEFVITDPDGEPPKEFFIGHIEKQSSTVLSITVFGERRHHLETGNVIQLREVTGMTELNGQNFEVTVNSPSQLTINVDTDTLPPYSGGGIAVQVKQPSKRSSGSLLEQLRKPKIVTTDLSRPDEGLLLHLIFLTLMKFRYEESRSLEPWNEADWKLFMKKLDVLHGFFSDKIKSLDVDFIRRLALVSSGQLAPLCAFFGSVAAQEAMKAITGSFSPFDQWLYMHCEPVVPPDAKSLPTKTGSSRYDPLMVCVGPRCLNHLSNLNVFMVGCGAIGCELLKNLALLGVATADNHKALSTQSDPVAIPNTACDQGPNEKPVNQDRTDLDNPHKKMATTPSVIDNSSVSIARLRYQSIPSSLRQHSQHSERSYVAQNFACAGDAVTDEFVPFTSTSAFSNSVDPTLQLMDVASSDLRSSPCELSDNSSKLSDFSALAVTPSGLPIAHASGEMERTNMVTNEKPSSSVLSESADLSPTPSPQLVTDSGSGSTFVYGQNHKTVGDEISTDTEYVTAPDSQPSCSSEAEIASEAPACQSPTDSVPDSVDPDARKHSGEHGTGVSSEGYRSACITITDPDHIEKSNLNRQFLFHPKHIGMSKSLVAADAARAINPNIRIRAMEQKLEPSNEKSVFTDRFLLEALGRTSKTSGDNTNVGDKADVEKQCSDIGGVVLAALDCVPTRRYLDTRCVALHLPLFESGTLGTKGHVQVILPGLTESYNSQRDDDSTGAESGDAGGSESIPYCTLKSFPARATHCIEWAREKFASQFTLKPGKIMQLLGPFSSKGETDSSQTTLELVGVASYLLHSYTATAMSTDDTEHPVSADDQAMIDRSRWLRSQLNPSLARFLSSRPSDWTGCIRLARDKFERYFNHKARQLLQAFPPGTKLPDGTAFWQLPRRQPTPIDFDVSNPLHRLFVVSFARLLVDQLNITMPADCPPLSSEDGPAEAYLRDVLAGYNPPSFVPSTKRIVTDESEAPADDSTTGQLEPASAPEMNTSDISESTVPADSNVSAELDDNEVHSLRLLISALEDPKRVKPIQSCHSVTFEKDDDRLAHVDFITAAANLRALMYGLPVTPRHEIRRIAGRIVPAIATTTAAVAGLVCLELVKYVADKLHGSPALSATLEAGNKNPSDCSLSARNAFLNLALPVILLSEPAPCVRTRLPNGVEFTLWDRWEVRVPSDTKSFELSHFISQLKRDYGLNAIFITQGNRVVYVNYLPMHKARLKKSFFSLLNYDASDKFVDLMVAYEPSPDGPPDADYIQGPPVRFILPHHT
ncbi:unnamed protein product [Calicophoron daubneyi]|uniref:Ubiquitin-activating enzyme E1 C-terminal domain-containing protein n=1 Tax=Calicophoron daubneyi TaxID=300641 RepID=A0AAV2TBE0_CALDB